MWVTMVFDADEGLYKVWYTYDGQIIEYKEFEDIRTAQKVFERLVVLSQQ